MSDYEWDKLDVGGSITSIAEKFIGSKTLDWSLQEIEEQYIKNYTQSLVRAKIHYPKFLDHIDEIKASINKSLHLCESPIEVFLLVEMLAHNWGTKDKPIVAKLDGTGPVIIVPQKKMAGYRLDFFLLSSRRSEPPAAIAVEADGADFHTDTEKDLERDQNLLKTGTHTIRFTGKQIIDHAYYCIKEIDEFAWNKECVDVQN